MSDNSESQVPDAATSEKVPQIGGPQKSTADFLRSLKITAGARFNAGKRLEHIDRRLTFLTALSSAYVIALTILPYFVNVPKEVSDHLNLLTVFLSIVIIISSLLQYSSANTVRAEQHHRSALEINELRRELQMKSDAITEDDFLRLSNRYNAVLQKYSINHDDVDFIRYQLERPQDFPWLARPLKFRMHVRQFFARAWPLISIIVVTVAVSLFVFGYAWPARTTTRGAPTELPTAGAFQ